MTTPRLYGPAGKCGVNQGAQGHPGEHNSDEVTGGPCTAAADTVVEFGCVHEHLFRERKCALHAQMIVAGLTSAEARMVCSDCWTGAKGGKPHECPLLGRIVQEGVTRR
jgi:hypothetical protein